ncbi:MAG: hypothetical protein E7658_06235 [Ruminococcaceae bacterium]|nr:hypothetical protein [Oscillospiraceae bacterium]
MPGLIIGAVFGLGQFLLLRQISARITGSGKGRIVPVFLIKVLLYGVLIAMALTVYREDVLLVGCGYAAGMGIGIVPAVISLFGKGGKEDTPAVPSPSDTENKTEGE